MHARAGLLAAVGAVLVGATVGAVSRDEHAGAAGPDTTGAAVWAYLQEASYQDTWSLWPGTEPMYEGTEPHGMRLTTYVNDAALDAIRAGTNPLPDGAIIVKENYTPNGDLAAITVMYKVQGFNPDHSDWFFSKHLPGGGLDRMPNGMAMEGRVPGCQSCHGGRSDNDYLFTSDLDG